MNFLAIIRNSPITLKRLISRIINLDSRLEKKIKVKYKGEKLFKIYNFGPITRHRAKSFETKEPETLSWINSFKKNEAFLDIGANIGIYSIFAALRGNKTVSIEPDALNYALLNLNFKENDLQEKAIAYCLAFHSENLFSAFNVRNLVWGSSQNSFDNNLDQWGNKYSPKHAQGIYGFKVDTFLEEINFQPNHIKIDVDGNEYLILLGSKKTLMKKTLKSILIELVETRKDYRDCISIIESLGFRLRKKTHAEQFNKGKYNTTYNHIFERN